MADFEFPEAADICEEEDEAVHLHHHHHRSLLTRLFFSIKCQLVLLGLLAIIPAVIVLGVQVAATKSSTIESTKYFTNVLSEKYDDKLNFKVLLASSILDTIAVVAPRVSSPEDVIPHVVVSSHLQQAIDSCIKVCYVDGTNFEVHNDRSDTTTSRVHYSAPTTQHTNDNETGTNSQYTHESWEASPLSGNNVSKLEITTSANAMYTCDTQHSSVTAPLQDANQGTAGQLDNDIQIGFSSSTGDTVKVSPTVSIFRHLFSGGTIYMGTAVNNIPLSSLLQQDALLLSGNNNNEESGFVLVIDKSTSAILYSSLSHDAPACHYFHAECGNSLDKSTCCAVSFASDEPANNGKPYCSPRALVTHFTGNNYPVPLVTTWWQHQITTSNENATNTFTWNGKMWVVKRSTLAAHSEWSVVVFAQNSHSPQVYAALTSSVVILIVFFVIFLVGCCVYGFYLSYNIVSTSRFMSEFSYMHLRPPDYFPLSPLTEIHALQRRLEHLFRRLRELKKYIPDGVFAATPAAGKLLSPSTTIPARGSDPAVSLDGVGTLAGSNPLAGRWSLTSLRRRDTRNTKSDTSLATPSNPVAAPSGPKRSAAFGIFLTLEDGESTDESDDDCNQVIKRRHDLEHHFEHRVVSVLHIKLVDFINDTSFDVAEKDMPRKVASTFIHIVHSSVAANSGVVLRFSANECVAVWNGHAPVPDHQFKACKTALAIRRRMTSQLSSVTFAMSIDCGDVLVGNAGSEVLTPVVLGDPVTIAAELIELTARLHSSIVLTSTINENVHSEFHCIPIDCVELQRERFIKTPDTRNVARTHLQFETPHAVPALWSNSRASTIKRKKHKRRSTKSVVYELRGRLESNPVLTDAAMLFKNAFSCFCQHRFVDAEEKFKSYLSMYQNGDPQAIRILRLALYYSKHPTKIPTPYVRFYTSWHDYEGPSEVQELPGYIEQGAASGESNHLLTAPPTPNNGMTAVEILQEEINMSTNKPTSFYKRRPWVTRASHMSHGTGAQPPHLARTLEKTLAITGPIENSLADMEEHEFHTHIREHSAMQSVLSQGQSMIIPTEDTNQHFENGTTTMKIATQPGSQLMHLDTEDTMTFFRVDTSEDFDFTRPDDCIHQSVHDLGVVKEDALVLEDEDGYNETATGGGTGSGGKADYNSMDRIKMTPVNPTTPGKLQVESFRSDSSNNQNPQPVALDSWSLTFNGVLTFTDSQKRVWQKSGTVLGTGAFGTVFLGMKPDGQLVALKVVNLPHQQNEDVVARQQSIADILQEVALLSSFHHDNIVDYISSAIVADHLIIVLEFVSCGSLSNIVQQFGALQESSVQRYARDVLRGLKYLHHNDIVHLDVKPHNVLLDERGICHLTDFGMSRKLQHALHPEDKDKHRDGIVGTPLYMPPEALTGRLGKAADIWSFGCTILHLISGQVPYADLSAELSRNPTALLYNMATKKDFRPSIPPCVSKHAATFINKCLTHDPIQRPSCDELLTDGWLL